MAVMQTRGFIAAWLLGVCLVGCGGGKPAEAPDSEDTAAEAKSDAAGDGAKAEADKAEDKPAEPEAAPTPSRSVQDIITAPDVLFLFSFNDSEPKQAAEEACTKKAGDDAKKMNQCMAAERKKFPADGHRFLKDEKDQWWWLTVRQSGNRLNNLHKIPIEFIDETDNSITLKPVGKDKGSAPMKPPAKVVVEVPNDYQIVFQDPKAGRLVFQAKVGVVSE